MVDSIYRSRSLGVGVEGLKDQYADGIAARLWELYIGDKHHRTKTYRTFLVNTLRNHNCKMILDVACGTGIDSILLLEEGFQMMSVDASDKMLKYALKERWNRRTEPNFNNWIIEEANWITLTEDIVKPPEGGFDALLCLGNSFAHLPDISGDMSNIKTAIRQFHDMIKPGGFLIIDHRNYDYILDTGKTHQTNIYYTSKYITEIITSILYVQNQPKSITLDYVMDVSGINETYDKTDSEYTKKGRYYGDIDNKFRLSYFPHRLGNFTKLLKEIFGENAQHELYGDFEPIENWSSTESPAFYVHIIKKGNNPKNEL